MTRMVQLIVAAALIAAACNSNQPTQEETAIAEAKRIARSGPVIGVTATDLAREYADNPIAADGRYKRKRLRVSGQITAITTDKDGLPMVFLGVGDQRNLVACDGVDGPQIAKYHTGDGVSLTGAMAGVMGTVPTLLFCEVSY